MRRFSNTFGLSAVAANLGTSRPVDRASSHTLPTMSRLLSASLALGLLVATVSITSCRKDKLKSQWDLNVLAPLAKTTLTIAYLVYNNGFKNSAMGTAAATAILLFIIIFAFTMLQRRVVGGEKAS